MIDRLHHRYRRRCQLAGALAVSGGGFWLGWFITDSWLGAWSVAISAAGLIGWLGGRRAPNRNAIARHLDRIEPSLEDSAELLLLDSEDLPPLARHQRQLVERRLAARPEGELLPRRSLVRAAAFGLGLWVAGGLWWFGMATANSRNETIARGSMETESAETMASPEVSHPLVVKIRHRVQPPAYTGLEPAAGDGLAVDVVRGSTVAWEAELTGVAENLFLEDPSAVRPLEQLAPGLWGWSLAASEDLPLRVVASGGETRRALTDWELVSVRQDEPPVVRIKQPERVVEIDENAIGRLRLEVLATDDFGLGSSTLLATLAQGSGENVEFREQRLELPAGEGSETTRAIGTFLDLADLGLQAGSELIFRVETRDRRVPKPQIGRSASRIVRVRGGSQATVGLGRGLPVLTPPEVFRSQRQIILDTEALLSDRPLLAAEEFRKRAETIGFDQRALRMRYGSLLGEETVAGAPVAVGHGHDSAEDEEGSSHDAEAHVEVPAPSEEHDDETPLVAGVPGDLAHSHDSAEMATFFPDPVRSGLRRALAAMWDAERRLRSVEPEKALPFERSALEELQELKRATRVYVARIGFDPPALDEDRRLGGDLDEISPRVPRAVGSGSADPFVVAFQRLTAEDPNPSELHQIVESLEGPASGLAGSERLRWLSLRSQIDGSLEIGDPISETVLDEIREALWNWAATPEARPSHRRTTATDSVASEAVAPAPGAGS